MNGRRGGGNQPPRFPQNIHASRVTTIRAGIIPLAAASVRVVSRNAGVGGEDAVVVAVGAGVVIGGASSTVNTPLADTPVSMASTVTVYSSGRKEEVSTEHSQ